MFILLISNILIGNKRQKNTIRRFTGINNIDIFPRVNIPFFKVRNINSKNIIFAKEKIHFLELIL